MTTFNCHLKNHFLARVTADAEVNRTIIKAAREAAATDADATTADREETAAADARAENRHQADAQASKAVYLKIIRNNNDSYKAFTFQ